MLRLESREPQWRLKAKSPCEIMEEIGELSGSVFSPIMYAANVRLMLLLCETRAFKMRLWSKLRPHKIS